MAAHASAGRAHSVTASAGPAPSEVATAWAKGPGKGTWPRAILIVGPETALREEALKGIRKAAFADGEGGMNWIVYHGPDHAKQGEPIEPATVLDDVFTLPMFGVAGEPKVVVLRNADFFLNAKHSREIFENALEQIPDGAVLVFEVGDVGKLKSTRFYKALAKAKAVVACEALRNRWGLDGAGSPLALECSRRADALGLELDGAAAAALIERSGQTLGVLEEELGKLALALGAQEGQRMRVDAATIEKVCSNTRLPDPFEYAEALVLRDAKKSLEVLGSIFAHGLGDYKRPGRVVTNESEIAMRLLGVVNWKLTQLQDVHSAVANGQSEFEVFKEKGVFGNNQDSMRRALRAFTPAAMRGAIEALFQANLALRTGGTPQAILEQLIWSVCRGSVYTLRG